MTKYGTNIYTYTLNGELKTKGNPEGVTVYDHDPMGNLVQVILPNSTVIGYTYDAKNRRVAKMVNGFITERLIYKDQLAPIAKVDADGNVLEEYIYGTGINSPDYIRKDGVNYRVIKDHLGSIRMIVNTSTGEVVKTLRYSEFGEITDETGTFNTIFGFAGGIRDTDTGLTKFGARWYDPEVGRWISKEPLGFEGAMNFYSYCDGDPVNKVDVTGLKPGDPFSDIRMLIKDVEKYTMTLVDADIYEYMAEIYVHSRTKYGAPIYAYRNPYHTNDSGHVEMNKDYDKTGVVAAWHSHIDNFQKNIRGYSYLSGKSQYDKTRTAPTDTDIGVAILLMNANKGYGKIFMTHFDVSYDETSKKPIFDILGRDDWGKIEW